VELSQPGDSCEYSREWDEVFCAQVGEEYAGSMTYEELTPAVAKEWQIES
jgi:hypothetical protein